MKNNFLFKKMLFISLFLTTGFIAKSQILSEGFESAVFPPAGWLNETTVGPDDALWETATSGEIIFDVNFADVIVDPHSGSGMAIFKSFDIAANNSAALTTPTVDLSTAGAKLVTFWMFRDNGYDTFDDSISVYINTSTGLTGATLLGTIHRYTAFTPVATNGNGWYRYSYIVPTGFTTATNYIIFNAVSGFGNNMFIDDITVEEFGACSGTPSAGTITGPAGNCSGTQIILESTGTTDASGMTYAWQSSASSTGSWTNIPGQTSFGNATATQTAVTYYRLFVTCTNSGLSDSSNVLNITVNPTNICYCKPPDVTLHSIVNDFITNVTIQGTTLNSFNGTDGGTGYTQVPSTPSNNTADLSQVVTYTITATVENDPIQVSCWVDFNNNGTFDAAEFTDLTISGTIASGSIVVPADAAVGETGLRLRARFANFVNTDACETFPSGETEDYLVNIVANTALNGALVDIIPPATACNATNNVIVKLRNSGNQNIAANTATVALYITGANPQGPLTQTNPSLLIPGDTATLIFTGSFTNEGVNADSAVIQSLTGDVVPGDDVIVTNHITLPAASNAPYTEDFEGSIPGWTVSQLAGAGNWGLSDTVYYPDYNPDYLLPAKSGTFCALFDSYTFNAGTISRLSSNCINIPVDANSNCGYIAGFYFTQDAQYITLQDSVVVNVSADGGNTYTRLGVVKRNDSTLAPTAGQAATSVPQWKLYTFDVAQYAGSTVQFAFDAYGNFGNMMAIDSFFVGPKTVAGNVGLAGGQETGASLSPSLTQCTDAAGWTYYSDANSARYLFGVQWDPSNAGANAAAKAQATAKITVDRKWYAAENVPLLMATYTMQRYWDIDLNGAVMTGPANVRFFYAQNEFDSIMAAKAAFIAANPGSTDEGSWWFKTVSPDEFIPSPASVTYDSVVNAFEIQNENFSNATINGVLYAQFNGITSFSGGTAATGVGPVTVVPVGLLSFTAQRNAKVNTLGWTTTQEINTNKFIVEHSKDGRNFTAIGEVVAAGSSANNINYSFIDYTPAMGVNFYRLKVIERNGSTKLSNVRSVRNEGTADIAVYPNPVKDRMLINITSDRIDKAVITISDMNGKLVQIKINAITEGSNYITINTAAMGRGTYIVKIQLNDDVVVKKVTKL